MLVHEQDSLEDIFKNVKHELRRGVLEKWHPFRFVPLATHFEDEIGMRYVVLRDVGQDLSCFIYTDTRTAKVRQISDNGLAVLLFYHPKKKVQIRLEGNPVIHYKNAVSSEHWENVPKFRKKEYGGVITPGARISEPEEAHHWPLTIGQNYFTVLEIKPFKIEVLQLDGVEHRRALFELNEANEWDKQWIAP